MAKILQSDSRVNTCYINVIRSHKSNLVINLLIQFLQFIDRQSRLLH